MSRYIPPSSDSGSDDENDTQYGTTDTKNTDEATDIDEEDQQSDPGRRDESPDDPENSGSDDDNDDQENSGSDDDNDEPRMTRDSAGRQRFRYKNDEGGYSYTYNEWRAGDRTPSGADQSLSPHRGDDNWRRSSEEGTDWLHDEDDSD
jgi:hypothetical protein